MVGMSMDTYGQTKKTNSEIRRNNNPIHRKNVDRLVKQRFILTTQKAQTKRIPVDCQGHTKHVTFCLVWFSQVQRKRVCKACINHKRGSGRY